MWQWFFKLGSPKWFYELSGKWLPWLVAAMSLLLVIGITWALLFVPPDYQQGNTIRIMYIHVPFASISLAFFPLMAVAGTITLVWRMKLADMVAKTAAPLGAWFTALALISGSIWGSDIWGTWWIWDGRLTSMLLQSSTRWIGGIPYTSPPAQLEWPEILPMDRKYGYRW